MSEGKFHIRQRRLAQPAFHHKRIAGYARIMADVTVELRDRWVEGETYDIAQEMNWLAMVIVLKTLFGAEIDENAGIGLFGSQDAGIRCFKRHLAGEVFEKSLRFLHAIGVGMPDDVLGKDVFAHTRIIIGALLHACLGQRDRQR